jgi:hypothetical protein
MNIAYILHRPPHVYVTTIAPKTSSETTEVAANPTLATLLHLPIGGGVDGGLELVVGGDGVDEELLQLGLALPPCCPFGFAAAALLD